MFETYYRLIKRDSKGNIIKDSGLIPSHSYVIQFLEYFEGNIASTDKIATDVDNAESEIFDFSDRMNEQGRADAAVGDDTHGIIVGINTGTTAEDNLNYALDTKIDHSGIGAAGDLNYQAVTFVTARVVGPNIDLDVSREFANETGNTITVKEIGLIVKNTVDTKYHLILRDVVADEAVDDAETLTVVYTLRTTV